MISIIIPFYNTGDSCVELIKSLINDRERDIEIICVDDASTDDSLKNVKAIAKKDKRIKVFHQEINQGSAAARNRGIKESSGDYIVFIDSDDSVAELFLNKMNEAMMQTGVILSICGIRQNYLKTGKIVDKFTSPISSKKDSEDWKSYILRLMIEDAHLYSCVNKIYKADIIREHKILFDTKLNFAEDTKFVLDYLKQANNSSKIISIPDPLYTYNYGTKTSVVSESSLVWENWLKSYNDIENWVGKKQSKQVKRSLKKLLMRFKISHAFAVARSKKSFRSAIRYENPFVLIFAKIIVLIRG